MEFSKDYTYAVVGASNDPIKYGHRVLDSLLMRGFKAVPINLKEGVILDQKVYKNLSQFEGKFDLVVFVVPPAVTLSILEEVRALGIKKIWMQPGSESAESIDYCEQNGIECMHDACIMLNPADDE